MPKPMIVVEGLSKSFSPPGRSPRTPLWALRDVSFSVEEGETLAVLGNNGAGKSTLLKVLSRITAPSAGSVRLRGRVGSLLEVGTGFHHDLSGRENIFMNGALLGMSRAEIHGKLDAIVAFAEIAEHLDLPVKCYSTGMYLRLAFAVAAHLESEILLVDEVLAVGDYSFREKCLAKTRELNHTGRTVLFVSHNLGALRQICGSALWLDRGQSLGRGPLDEIVGRYLGRSAPLEAVHQFDGNSDLPMSLSSITISAGGIEPRARIAYHEPVRITIDYRVNRSLQGAAVSLGVHTGDGSPVFVTTDHDTQPHRLIGKSPGHYRTTVEIPARWLNPGRFQLAVYLLDTPRDVVFQRFDRFGFEILDTGSPNTVGGLNFRKGPLQPFLPWSEEPIAEPPPSPSPEPPCA